MTLEEENAYLKNLLEQLQAENAELKAIISKDVLSRQGKNVMKLESFNIRSTLSG